MALKIQRVRWCVQCKDCLPLKCKKCAKHPNRVPQVVEVYDVPEIFKTHPCGCVQIKCEVPEDVKPDSCQGYVHRRLAEVKRSKSRFCSKVCFQAWSTVGRGGHVMVKCEECHKPIKRYRSNLSRYRYSTCSGVCNRIHRLRMKDKEASKKAPAPEAVKEPKGRLTETTYQLLSCYSEKHRGEVTNHTRVVGQKNTYSCDSCGQVRDDRVEIPDMSLIKANAHLKKMDKEVVE